ncbi:MAG: hypothetical protein E7270_00930 [Lachnospiraceae bacterium]|nr:hypothetical protein [Lachnospiraceae bacterium]
MKLSFGKVVDMLNVCKELKEVRMPFKLSLILAKNIKTLELENDFYIEREREFAMKYLEIDNETGQFKMISDGIFKIKEGLEDECREAREELNKFEVELNLHKIPMSLIENMDCFTPEHLMALEELIAEEE